MVQGLDCNSWTVTVRGLNSNSSNIYKKRMITIVGQRMMILIDEMREHKI